MEGCTVCTFVIHILLFLLKPRCVSQVPNLPPSLLLFFRFLRLWIAVLVIYPTNQAVIALTFSNYVLQPLFPTCFPPENGLRLLAGVCLCKCRFFPPLLVLWREKLFDLWSTRTISDVCV